MGCNLLPVDSDSNGLIPEKLLEMLSPWKPADAGDPTSDIPKVLYCIPNGGNPTGSGLTLSRKQEIYKIAQDYNLMILEDDPYYYIQFADVRLTVCLKQFYHTLNGLSFQEPLAISEMIYKENTGEKIVNHNIDV